MGIPSRVLLWLEQRVKVPEAALHPLVGGHLLKAHLREDLAKLRANLWAGKPLLGRAACDLIGLVLGYTNC